MTLRVPQGSTIRLPAEFFSGEDPADPKDPRVSVIDPDNNTIVADAVPERDKVGVYHFAYAVAPDAPVGRWKANWTGTIDGKEVGGEDTFEVLEGVAGQESEATEAAVSPLAQPVRAAPTLEQKAAGAGSKRKPLPILIAAVLLVVIVAAAAFFFFLRDERPSARESLRAGLAAHKAGNLEKARDHYEDVLKTDPRNKYAHFNLGVMEQEAGRTAEAERRYVRALEADPNFTPALFNLAITYETAQQDENAEQMYRRIIAVNPGHASARLNLGFLLIRKLGRQAEGEAELRRAVRLDRRLISRVPAEIRARVMASPPPPGS